MQGWSGGEDAPAWTSFTAPSFPATLGNAPPPTPPASAWPSWRIALYNCSSHGPDLLSGCRSQAPSRSRAGGLGVWLCWAQDPSGVPKNTALICMQLCITFAYQQETDPDLPVECPGVSSGGVGQLATGSGQWVRQCVHGTFWRRLPLSSPDTSSKIPFDHWKWFNRLRTPALGHLGVTWACFGNAHVYSPPNSNYSANPTALLQGQSVAKKNNVFTIQPYQSTSNMQINILRWLKRANFPRVGLSDGTSYCFMDDRVRFHWSD